MNRWSQQKAGQWWQSLPWLIGANYIPSDAVNTIEMWMRSTFNADLIRKELAWASNIGMNTVRVFLSFTVWNNERVSFLESLEQFLQIADSCGILVMPILFDDCAFDKNRDPVYGKQPSPKAGIHNGRWVPSPGALIQDSPESYRSLKTYVEDIVSLHASDPRIVVWDLFNEPGNSNRLYKSLPLLVQAFRWARECQPVQPLTAGLWCFDEEWKNMNGIIADLSDILSFHAYGSDDSVKALVQELQASGRPLLITEWMNRRNGNSIPSLLPYFHDRKIGAWQWGLVNGKTQTHLTWASSRVPELKPGLWFHDLLRNDGTPYDPEEVSLIHSLSGSPHL